MKFLFLKILFFLALNTSFLMIDAQIKPEYKLLKINTIKGNSFKKYKEEIKVIIYFPKKSITKEQLYDILRPENSVVQTSSVPLISKSECKENIINISIKIERKKNVLEE